MRPSIRSPGLKGAGKTIPASRPTTPKAPSGPAAPKPAPATLPRPQSATDDSKTPLSLKRKVEQISSPVPGPRPKLPNSGKGPTPSGPKPMPMNFPEKGEHQKGEKGGKGAAPSHSAPGKGQAGQTPKAAATAPPGKPTSNTGSVMPPKSKSAPEVAAEKPDGPKPPATEPPGYGEKRFLPTPKVNTKTPESSVTPGGKPGPTPPSTVPPKAASKGVLGKADKGKGSGKTVEAKAGHPEAEPAKGKAGKGKGAEAPTVNSENFQVQFRLKNLESLQTRLLAELSGLPEAQRGEGLSKILDALTRAAPRPALQQHVDKLAADGIIPSNGSAAPQAEEAPAAPAEAPEANEAQEDEPTLAQAMEDFLQNVENAAPTEYGKTWAALAVPREAEVEVLSGLLEVAVQKTSNFELVPKVVVELARTRKVTVPNLEAALKDLARKVEDHVQTNDQAWHLISYFLVYLFPRSRSCDYGFVFPSWNYPSWWRATEEILQEAHKYRAFDILVLVLQLMQEKSGAVIKELPVWSDPVRASHVRQVLCKWGDMDEASILETLSANGVELGK